MKKKSKSFLGTASLLNRILALFLDLFIIYFVIARPFYRLILSVLPDLQTTNYSEIIEILNSSPEIVNNLTLIFFSISIISLIYFSYMEYKFSQTFGQMALGLKIKSEKKETNIWQYVLTNLFVFPFFPFIILWFLDPIYMFYKGKKYTEHIAKLKMEQVYVIKDGKK